MEWRGRRGSRNIEDRRATPGSSRGLSVGRAGGVGGFGVIAVVVIGYFLGIDVTPLLDGGSAPVSKGGPVEITAADEAAAEFVSVTLADTEEVWTKVFAEQMNAAYTPATLVLFKGSTQSPCGGASGATGPFYCPVDRKVYLDTDFFTTLDRQLGAKGDFASAYVVAHEIAHHVQGLMGTLEQANAVRLQSSEVESNAISVRIELQADCYAGIWAREASNMLGSIQPGDFEEAFNAARQIGDDALQAAAGRPVSPEGFTHGTSAQRSGWFARGLRTGDMAQCDTFSTDDL